MQPIQSQQPTRDARLPALADHAITVLLVDDQVIVGEAVRRMLAPEKDIIFHHCNNPMQAIDLARELHPTIILQDLVMPDIDGLMLTKFYRANPATKDIPLIVLSTKEEPATKAQAFAVGANDYLVKLPDRVELIARIRYHSRGYINLLQRNEAYRKLEESQKALAQDVAQAETYVMSLLPSPINKGPVITQNRFIPSAMLGGDSFGHHWIDKDHFAFYLLDVCGHGVKAALLSVSAMNVLRAQSLPECNFRSPASVLGKLNEAFPMEKQNNMYFTIWYGVYKQSTRELSWAGGGHPSALLLMEGVEMCHELASQGPMIGAFDELPFDEDTVTLEPNSRVYVYSDGCCEINMTNNLMWEFQDFVKFMAQPLRDGETAIDRLVNHTRAIHGSDMYDDDFSILELNFA